MRPIIALTPSHDAEKSQFFLRENYSEAVLQAGGLPVVLPYLTDARLMEVYLEGVDGILLTGGGDVAPERYHTLRIPSCGPQDDARDAFELLLIEKALERDLPIFGICRGFQVLAVALGGTLIQDLEAEAGLVASAHLQRSSCAHPTHEVVLEAGGLLAKLTGRQVLYTNTSHHQAIREAGRLVPDAHSSDGVIEAGYLRGKPHVFGVQYHPEYLAASDPSALALFKHLVQCASARGASRKR